MAYSLALATTIFVDNEALVGSSSSTCASDSDNSLKISSGILSDLDTLGGCSNLSFDNICALISSILKWCRVSSSFTESGWDAALSLHLAHLLWSPSSTSVELADVWVLLLLFSSILTLLSSLLKLISLTMLSSLTLKELWCSCKRSNNALGTMGDDVPLWTRSATKHRVWE